MSHFNPPSQNNNSCMLRMPMFIFSVSRTSNIFHLSIDYLLDKKMYLHPLVMYENWGNPYKPHYRVVVPKSIEMPAIFGLDARWSVYYAHCTSCIALKLALTTLQFKWSHIKIEYSKLKIDSPMRRTNKSANLLYLF